MEFLGAQRLQREALEDKAILEAVNRAVTLYGFCPNRVWAVASSHPDNKRILPQLFPPNDAKLQALCAQARTGNNNPEVHRGCTFDFCEQSQMNFTSVSQRHESPSCRLQPCGRIEDRFSAEVLNEAATNDESTAWHLHGLRTIPPYHKYMAVSHVWSDGTGAGTWPAGEVNICLFHFFASIARSRDCDGIWWDTLCIPTNKAARSKAIANMQAYYQNAQFTLVHDCFLREVTYKDPETACIAILMSPWFSRGWTAVELANSKTVLVEFRKSGSKYILKDLDEILHQPKTPRHKLGADIINTLRQQEIPDLNLLLNVLKSRHTSWARDIPLISALLVGFKVPNQTPHEDINRGILSKIRTIAHGHMFHSSPTMFHGTSWCPAHLSTLPVSSPDAPLSVDDVGNVSGFWRMALLDNFPQESFSFGAVHPLSRVRICAALTRGETRLLFEPTAFIPIRALVVEIVATNGPSVFCHFIGAISLDERNGCRITSLPMHHIVISYDGANGTEKPHNSQNDTSPRDNTSQHPVLSMSSEHSPKPPVPIGPQPKDQSSISEAEQNIPKNYVRFSALKFAFQLERPEPPTALLEEASNPSRVVISDNEMARLFSAARADNSGDFDMIKNHTKLDLMKEGVCCDSSGRTLISWPAGKGHWHTLHRLLQCYSFFNLDESWSEETDDLGAVDYSRNCFSMLCNMTDRDGRSPLSWASAEGNVETVAGLLRYPEVQIDAVDTVGWTPLWYAANNNHIQVMKRLLDAGADQNLRDKAGMILLERVAAKGTTAALRALLEREVESEHKKSALNEAASYRHAANAEILIQSGATPDPALYVIGLAKGDPIEDAVVRLDQGSPIHDAVVNGDLTTLKILIEATPVPDGPDKNLTDLKRAVYVTTLRDRGLAFIVSSGPRAEHTTYHDHAALLHFVLKNLLDNGDKTTFSDLVDYRSVFGKIRSVHVAAMAGDADLLSLLIEPGKTNVWDKGGKNSLEPSGNKIASPLYLAAMRGHISVVEMILNASETAPRGECKKALSVAKNHGHHGIENLIGYYMKHHRRGFFPS